LSLFISTSAVVCQLVVLIVNSGVDVTFVAQEVNSAPNLRGIGEVRILIIEEDIKICYWTLKLKWMFQFILLYVFYHK